MPKYTPMGKAGMSRNTGSEYNENLEANGRR